MRDIEIYERRAREAEELAALVSLPQNRLRYLAMAAAWRQLSDDRQEAKARSSHGALTLPGTG
jgi:hypothetical protein